MPDYVTDETTFLFKAVSPFQQPRTLIDSSIGIIEYCIEIPSIIETRGPWDRARWNALDFFEDYFQLMEIHIEGVDGLAEFSVLGVCEKQALAQFIASSP